MRHLGFPLESFIITVMDSVSIHPYFLAVSSSFSLKRFIPLESLSNVSGIFSVSELNSLIPVPDV